MAFVTGYAPDEARVCLTLAAMSYVSESAAGALPSRLKTLLADRQYAAGGRWEFLRTGGNVIAVQKLPEHASVATTQRYLDHRGSKSPSSHSWSLDFALVAPTVANAVADKGCHSNAVMLALATAGVRSYIAEPERGRRCWDGKPAERDAVYRNRRRIRGAHGKALLRSRGELLERPFAHALETSGMRRTHLRRHENILKRLLIHLGGLNLGLLMRTRFGIGTPRGLQGRADGLAAFLPTLWRLWDAVVAMWVGSSRPRPTLDAFPPPQTGWPAIATSGEARLAVAVFTTGC
jgi:hypothetical protein